MSETEHRMYVQPGAICLQASLASLEAFLASISIR